MKERNQQLDQARAQIKAECWDSMDVHHETVSALKAPLKVRSARCWACGATQEWAGTFLTRSATLWAGRQLLCTWWSSSLQKKTGRLQTATWGCQHSEDAAQHEVTRWAWVAMQFRPAQSSTTQLQSWHLPSFPFPSTWRSCAMLMCTLLRAATFTSKAHVRIVWGCHLQ